jgi:hypothetical protein
VLVPPRLKACGLKHGRTSMRVKSKNPKMLNKKKKKKNPPSFRVSVLHGDF